ncbi:hypothetical protein [Bradyrhizobium liaoningense]|uniref:hypothetical protein n=1 Tax=Bradyrhizobium liaoningense TaxID=43992 RepID=UPI00055285D9|nr:hypothetical protein [Bradyrhizobium liaoningense]
MATYIVTYDLNKEIKRPNIVGAIHEFGSWAKLSESSYAINSDLNPEQVYQRLLKHLDDNDQLYVITLRKPYYGQGSQEVNDWLESSLF